MRTLLFATAGVLLAGCGGCGLNVFHTEVKGGTTIEAASPLLPGGLLESIPAIGSFTSIDFNQNQDFQNQGVSKDQVTSVRVESLDLRLVSPDDGNFDFLDELEFFASAGDRTVRIADRFNIPSLGLVAPNPTLELDVRDAELQPLVTAPSMSIEVRGKGRPPPKETTLEATVRLRIEFEIF